MIRQEALKADRPRIFMSVGKSWSCNCKGAIDGYVRERTTTACRSKIFLVDGWHSFVSFCVSFVRYSAAVAYVNDQNKKRGFAFLLPRTNVRPRRIAVESSPFFCSTNSIIFFNFVVCALSPKNS